MNMLTNRIPTHTTITDACLAGFGGFAMNSGRAWRYKFPSKPAVSINVLEFMACVIEIWLELLHDNIKPEDCILALTDNKSAAGWLHKCNTNKTLHRIRTATAHKLAKLGMKYGFIVHPQHIKGTENEAADALSRRFDLSDAELTNLLVNTLPHQIPSTFKIVALPNEISSWVSFVLAPNPSLENPPPSPMPTVETESGSDGEISSKKLGWETIFSLTTSLLHPDGNSADVSCKHAVQDTTGKDDTNKQWCARVQSSFLDGLSAKPLATWLRNSGTTIGLLPSTSKALRTGLHPAFENYSKRGTTKTREKTEK